MTVLVADQRLAALDPFEVGTRGDARGLKVVALASGGFVAAWEYGNGLLAQMFDRNGIAIGGTFHLESSAATPHSQIALAPLANGGFVATWWNFAQPDPRAEYRLFDPAGQPLAAEQPVATAYSQQPQASSLADGGFVIAFTARQAGGSNDIRAQLFDSAGAKVGADFLVNTTTTNDQYYPLTAALPGGGFLVTWIDFNVIRGQVFDGSGQKVGSELNLAPAGNWAPSLTALPSGNVILVYFNGDLMAKILSPTGAVVVPEFKVNTTVSGTEYMSSVAVLPSGEFLITWRDSTQQVGYIQDGEVRGQLFAADGTKIGSEYLVNTVTSGGQSEPVSTAFGSGDVATLWLDYNGGGSQPIVQARLFYSTLMGTAGADVLDGADRNFVYALGGDDLATGGSAADEIDGGEGDDSLSGEGGDDLLVGGGGHDTLDGGAGDDRIDGGEGNDMLYVSGAGHDEAAGGGGTDHLFVDHGDAASDIAMTLSSDPGGGQSGTITDSAARQLTFTGIENLYLATGSGNDDVKGFAGDSYVQLGAGDDRYTLGSGFNSADGGDGLDGLSADFSARVTGVFWSLANGAHNMIANYFNFEYFVALVTGSGQDHITTANHDLDDRVTLGGGNDSVILWNGDDVAKGGAASDGGANSGLDTLILNYGQSTAGVHNVGALTSQAAGYSGQFGDGGTRLVTFDAFDRFLIATGTGQDNITTGDGNDEVRTAGGNDILVTGGGNDLLDGGSGDDVMTGGTGNDSYTVGSAEDVVNENANEGTDTITTFLATYSLAGLPNVENLAATAGTLSRDFRGNSGDNIISGGDGADLLRLHDGGDDIVEGRAGNDNIFFIGSLGNGDLVNGGEGTDTLVLQGPYGSLTLTSNVFLIENISILGGDNTNFGEPGTNRYDYVLTTHDSNFAAGVQARINGAALLEGEDFTFDGSAETDAKFVVYGGKGRDTLLGGLGNDIFFYAEERFASGDTVNGGAGYDGMFLRGNYTIDFNAPGYTGLFTNIENLTLTSATDERYARGGGTEFDYNLTLSDAIVGAGQLLTVSGALLMATETMVLDASQETDGMLRLFGGAAADTLKGGALADFIHGNFGADTLAGGGGADVFRYQSVTESYSVATDHIIDFTPGTDRIELDRIDADQQILGGDQAFTWIGSNAFSNQAGQLRAFQSGAQWIVEGDINGDGYADLVIALTLQGPTPLGAGDFIL